MGRQINSVKDKLQFYKEELKNENDMYVLVKNGSKQYPLYIFKTNSVPSGFAEFECELFGGYTYNKYSPEQKRFMIEQGYTIIDDLAYDIQPIPKSCEFDQYFGTFERITKSECTQWMKTH